MAPKTFAIMGGVPVRDRSDRASGDPSAGSEGIRPTTPQPIAPIPGDLNPWSDVAKYVGIILPGKFAGPPPAPAERSYPGLTSHTAKRVKNTAGTDEPPKYEIQSGKTQYFLHTFPASMIHGVDPADPVYGHLSRLPSAWPSAVGETGTVVRVGENHVLTARHVWDRVKDAAKDASKGVYVVFDFQDPGESPRYGASPSDAAARDDGGWGRPVRAVGHVDQNPTFAGGTKDPYELHEDWVILQTEWVTGASVPRWNPDPRSQPYKFESMKDTDWYNGRRKRVDENGKPEKPVRFEKFDLDRLVLIGHPLGIAKQVADGGKVILANRDLFQHDLVSLTGNSGAPIFRAALGNEGEIWLVGISLSGRDERRDSAAQPGDVVRADPLGEPPKLRAHENIALDIRRIAEQVAQAGGVPSAAAKSTNTRFASGSPPANKQDYGTLFQGDVALARLTKRLAPSSNQKDSKWRISTQQLVLDAFELGDYIASIYRTDGTQLNLTRDPPDTDTFCGEGKADDIGVLATLEQITGYKDDTPLKETLVVGFAVHETPTGGAYAYVIDTDVAGGELLQSRQNKDAYSAPAKNKGLVFLHRKDPAAISHVRINCQLHSGMPSKSKHCTRDGANQNIWIADIDQDHRPVAVEFSLDNGVNWAAVALPKIETRISAAVIFKDSKPTIESNAQIAAPTDVVIELDLAEIVNNPPKSTTFTSFTSATVTVDGVGLKHNSIDNAGARLYSFHSVPPVKEDENITFKYEINFTVDDNGTPKALNTELTLTLTAKPPAP